MEEFKPQKEEKEEPVKEELPVEEKKPLFTDEEMDEIYKKEPDDFLRGQL